VPAAAPTHTAPSLTPRTRPRRRPNLTGGLTLAGLLLFSGSCYTAALRQDRAFGRLAPYGGFSLIAAWLSLLL
jgi:uncharacterized membrane protein YgdD (TMEM256/DUF423 family)